MTESHALTPREPDFWRQYLGVLPVALHTNTPTQYVMLNGTRGNFCLEIAPPPDVTATELIEEPANAHNPGNAQSVAWSADVGHYLRLSSNGALLYRWDRPFPHQVSLDELSAETLPIFQERLEREEPVRELSVPLHAKRIFNTLRTLMDEGRSGYRALDAFLVLIACIASKKDREELNLRLWNLDESQRAAALQIEPGIWETLMAELSQPRTLHNISLIADLTLRHAAGQLFQEAHYAASLPDARQLTLQGVLPKPSQRRNDSPVKGGVFFTPSALVRSVVEISLNALPLPAKEHLLIFDPACGSGEFLREAHRQLRQSGFGGHIELHGADISEAAVSMARFVLAPSNLDQDPSTSVLIVRQDSVENSAFWPSHVDLLLMNPPFISWWDLSDKQRDLMKQRVGTVRSKPDFSMLFVKRALTCLGKRGVFGSVLPTSMFDSEAAAKLREDIASTLSVRFIGRLGNLSMFTSGTVDAALFVGTCDAAGPTTMLWSDHRPRSVVHALKALRSRRSAIVSGDGFSIYDNELVGSKQWSPRPYEGIAILNSNQKLPLAGSLFDIRQGVITGANDAFVLTEEEWQLLPIAERDYFRSAVLNASIAKGRLYKTDRLLYPYENDKLVFGNGEVFRQTMPVYFKRHIEPNLERLQSRSLNRGQWWALFRPRSGQDRPKIVSTYYGSEGSFAFDERGDYVVVQGYSWFPRGVHRKRAFNTDVGYAYAALLNSRFFFRALSATARQVGGGQFDLSDRFVSEVPVPDFFEARAERSVALLADYGKMLAGGYEVDSERLEINVESFYVQL